MKRLFLPLLTATIAVAAGCPSQNRTVHLTLGTSGEGVDGFLCRQSARPTHFLIERVIDTSSQMTLPASIVVDFIPLGTDPGCRTSELIAWCRTNDCSPDLSTRLCVPVPARPYGGLGLDARTAVASFIDQSLSGKVVADPAPRGPVVVRMVGTTQPCSQLTTVATFDPSQLFGCAYGGPVDLLTHDGSLFLGFDTLSDLCEPAVDVCASADLRIP